MNRITRMVHGRGTVSELMKQGPGQEVDSHLLAFSKVSAPVVFWNLTGRCNLSCRHCYNSSGPGVTGEGELTTTEARRCIDDLAAMGVPLILLSGGEPLLRQDFWELVAHAREQGIRLALSTNGTLITAGNAIRLRDSGVEYVGISIDGADPDTHDRMRNSPGSFQRAVEGLLHCRDTGIQCGIRFTITMENRHELEPLLSLASDLGIPRFCLYWLVPSGRGRTLARRSQLTSGAAREALDLLYRQARSLDPKRMEILTVDAPQDTIYILQEMDKEQNNACASARHLAACMGAGCSAGLRVVSIDPSGNMYPCQFAQEDQFLIGNVRVHPLSELWDDESNPVLSLFRNKTGTLTGKCRECPSLSLCGGGCRVRAYRQTGSFGGDDPLCMYL